LLLLALFLLVVGVSFMLQLETQDSLIQEPTLSREQKDAVLGIGLRFVRKYYSDDCRIFDA
jgi:hypothetical protein